MSVPPTRKTFPKVDTSDVVGANTRAMYEASNRAATAKKQFTNILGNAFDIKDALVNALVNAQQTIKESKLSSNSRTVMNFDGLDYQDNEIYIRTNSKLQKRNENNQFIDIAELTKENVVDITCGELGLKGESGQMCRMSFANCILDNDNSKATECLSKMGNSNMFNLVKKELANMRPEVVKHLLGKLGINMSKINGISKPETYDSWKSRNTTYKDVNGLDEYVKNLIEFTRSNPALLNEDYTGSNSVAPDMPADLRKYLESVDRSDETWYTTPSYMSNDGKKWAAKMAMASFNAVPFGIPSFNGSIALTNAIPFRNAMLGSRMFGGDRSSRKWEGHNLAQTTSSGLLTAMFQGTIDELQSSGLELNADDKQVIDNSIKEVDTYENRLERLYILLNELNNVQRVINESNCSEKPSGRQVLDLSKVINNQDAVDWLYTNVESLKSCIENNSDQKGQLCTKIHQHIAQLKSASSE